ncbi:transcription repressor MYB6-like [Fagus crenata]
MQWSLIAGRLLGRTDNEIKNYWNSSLCKRVQADDDKIHEQGNKLKNMESIRKSMSKSNLGIKPIAHQDLPISGHEAKLEELMDEAKR